MAPGVQRREILDARLIERSKDGRAFCLAQTDESIKPMNNVSILWPTKKCDDWLGRQQVEQISRGSTYAEKGIGAMPVYLVVPGYSHLDGTKDEGTFNSWAFSYQEDSFNVSFCNGAKESLS